jgi:hypothetical protein
VGTCVALAPEVAASSEPMHAVSVIKELNRTGRAVTRENRLKCCFLCMVSRNFIGSLL